MAEVATPDFGPSSSTCRSRSGSFCSFTLGSKGCNGDYSNNTENHSDQKVSKEYIKQDYCCLRPQSPVLLPPTSSSAVIRRPSLGQFIEVPWHKLQNQPLLSPSSGTRMLNVKYYKSAHATTLDSSESAVSDTRSISTDLNPENPLRSINSYTPDFDFQCSGSRIFSPLNSPLSYPSYDSHQNGHTVKNKTEVSICFNVEESCRGVSSQSPSFESQPRLHQIFDERLDFSSNSSIIPYKKTIQLSERVLYGPNSKFSSLERQTLDWLISCYLPPLGYRIENDIREWEFLLLRLISGRKIESLVDLKERIDRYLHWKTYDVLKASDEFRQHSKKGFLYCYGASKWGHPVLILRASFLSELSESSITLLSAHLLEVVKSKLLKPGVIDQWVFLIDMKEAPHCVPKLLQFLTFLDYCYSGYTAALFFINILAFNYEYIIRESGFPSLFIHRSQLTNRENILTYISSTQLQHRYGGAAGDAEQFDELYSTIDEIVLPIAEFGPTITHRTVAVKHEVSQLSIATDEREVEPNSTLKFLPDTNRHSSEPLQTLQLDKLPVFESDEDFPCSKLTTGRTVNNASLDPAFITFSKASTGGVEVPLDHSSAAFNWAPVLPALSFNSAQAFSTTSANPNKSRNNQNSITIKRSTDHSTISTRTMIIAPQCVPIIPCSTSTFLQQNQQLSAPINLCTEISSSEHSRGRRSNVSDGRTIIPLGGEFSSQNTSCFTIATEGEKKGEEGIDKKGYDVDYLDKTDPKYAVAPSGDDLGSTCLPVHSELKINKYISLNELIASYKPSPEHMWRGNIHKGTFRRLLFGVTHPFEVFEVNALRTVMQIAALRRVTFDGTVFQEQSERLRFLQAYNWNVEEFLDAALKHLEWRASRLPINPESFSLLQCQGFCYVYGRDRKYRPIIVCQVKQSNSFDVKQGFENLLYWIEYCLKYLMVNGKIEQFTVIVNLEEVAVLKLPTLTARNYVNELITNYPNRLHKIFFVKTPPHFRVYWKMCVEAHIPATIQLKLRLLSNNSTKEIFKDISQSQVEERLGGKGRNVSMLQEKNYFEPIMPLLRMNRIERLRQSQRNL